MPSAISHLLFFTTCIIFAWSELTVLTTSASDDLPAAVSKAKSHGLCIPPNANNNSDQDQLPCVCTKMVPRSTTIAPQSSPCPWKITPNTTVLRQYYSQTVTLGSNDPDPDKTFHNYIITAKSKPDEHIVGHFEQQWDAIAVCCYEPGRDYSYEGKRLHPNLLVGSPTIRVPRPNQTVVWTSPRDFEGTVVLVATFWKSAKLYWSNVESAPIQIVKRNYSEKPIARYIRN